MKNVNYLFMGLFSILCVCCTGVKEEPLRVGTNLWVGYEPLYLARHLGEFDEMNISLQELPSASDVLNAFRNGLIDCATLTLDESFMLLQDGYDIRVLFIMDISDGGDVLLARPELDSLSDLVGKTIAVENSAVGAYTLSRALQKGGLKTTDVNIEPIVVSGHKYIYEKGDVDAVVTFEPARTNILELGAKELFSSKEIPNEIVDVFVVRADVFKNRHDELQMLKSKWFKALEHFIACSDTMFNFNGRRLKFTKEQMQSALGGIKFPTKEENAQILERSFITNAMRVQSIMLENKLLHKDFDVSVLLKEREE